MSRCVGVHRVGGPCLRYVHVCVKCVLRICVQYVLCVSTHSVSVRVYVQYKRTHLWGKHHYNYVNGYLGY